MFFGRQSTPEDDKPFQAVIRPRESSAPEAIDPAAGADPSEEGWSVDEIEAAYMRALEAAESVAEPDFVPSELVEDPVVSEIGEADEVAVDESRPAEQKVAFDAEESDEPKPPVEETPRVTPRQIVEALLFVGGRPLTSRQLADVLGGSTTAEHVDDLVQGLNTEYARQQRPYEVRLGEGGYRLDLHSEYDKVRARVFGIGPREVKLAQNALEVLALVAYQQPLSKAAVEDSGIHGASGLLRQLLRRELIVLQRGSDGEPDTYRTTPRFLELFGLRSLADLPRPEAVNLR